MNLRNLQATNGKINGSFKLKASIHIPETSPNINLIAVISERMLNRQGKIFELKPGNKVYSYAWMDSTVPEMKVKKNSENNFIKIEQNLLNPIILVGSFMVLFMLIRFINHALTFYLSGQSHHYQYDFESVLSLIWLYVTPILIQAFITSKKWFKMKKNIGNYMSQLMLTIDKVHARTQKENIQDANIYTDDLPDRQTDIYTTLYSISIPWDITKLNQDETEEKIHKLILEAIDNIGNLTKYASVYRWSGYNDYYHITFTPTNENTTEVQIHTKTDGLVFMASLIIMVILFVFMAVFSGYGYSENPKARGEFLTFSSYSIFVITPIFAWIYYFIKKSLIARHTKKLLFKICQTATA